METKKIRLSKTDMKVRKYRRSFIQNKRLLSIHTKRKFPKKQRKETTKQLSGLVDLTGRSPP